MSEPTPPVIARRARRRARRRRTLALVAAGVLVLGGAGSAWALAQRSGPQYRLATARRADVAQTVAADGSLAASGTATQSFGAAGTVQSVLVKAGDRVTAGESLATLDSSSLRADVTSARATLASARGRLADDESAQASGTSSTSSSTGSGSTGSTSSTGTSSGSSANTGATSGAESATTESFRTVRLTAAVTSTLPGAAVAAVQAAQREVVSAQTKLDSAVDALDGACTTSGDTETTTKVTATTDGSVSGNADATAVVTLAGGTTSSTNPQTVNSGDSYDFGGLTAGQSYSVVVVPVVDAASCSSAIDAVASAKGSADNPKQPSLYWAIGQLDDAVAALQKAATSTSSGGGAGGSGGSGSTTRGTGSKTGGSTSTHSGSTSTGRTGSSSGSRTSTSTATSGSTASTSSGSSSSSTTTVTSEQIAADAKSIDSAKAALAVAKHDMQLATLTTPISGTVASVDLAKGDTVAASSSSDAITVEGSGALSMSVDIGISDIDLVKVGEHAKVSVDGRSAAVAGHVTYVGVTNSSDSTGSSSTYPVTITLDARDRRLYDGMGASVAIDVGSAKRVVTVPASAVHTSGKLNTVQVYAHGAITRQAVTVGLSGDDRVQIKSGLSAGDEVVIADLGASLPSSDSTSSRGSGGGLSGFGGSGGGVGGGGRFGGGTGGGPP